MISAPRIPVVILKNCIPSNALHSFSSNVIPAHAGVHVLSQKLFVGKVGDTRVPSPWGEGQDEGSRNVHFVQRPLTPALSQGRGGRPVIPASAGIQGLRDTDEHE